MYSYIKDNEKGGKTAKGIKKNVIKNNITHENYRDTLFNNKQMLFVLIHMRRNGISQFPECRCRKQENFHFRRFVHR